MGDDDPAVLRYVAELGIAPQTYVDVIARAPFDGPLTVSVGGRTLALGKSVADQIFVNVEAAGRGAARTLAGTGRRPGPTEKQAWPGLTSAKGQSN